MRTTMTTKPRKYPPKDEREEDMRHTLVAVICGKLNRMDIDQLREILSTATRVIEGKK